MSGHAFPNAFQIFNLTKIPGNGHFTLACYAIDDRESQRKYLDLHPSKSPSNAIISFSNLFLCVFHEKVKIRKKQQPSSRQSCS